MDENEKTVQGAGEGADGTVENPVDSVDYKTLYTGLCETVKELQAERDSLKNENEGLRKQSAELAADSAKVRETNYTLSRQLNIQQEEKRAPEELLASMFLKKGE